LFKADDAASTAAKNYVSKQKGATNLIIQHIEHSPTAN